MNRAQSILKKVFGFETFWPLQKKGIAHILEKKDALAVMPTGGGKSLCYQIPARIFGGLAIMVSRLIFYFTTAFYLTYNVSRLRLRRNKKANFL